MAFVSRNYRTVELSNVGASHYPLGLLSWCTVAPSGNMVARDQQPGVVRGNSVLEELQTATVNVLSRATSAVQHHVAKSYMCEWSRMEFTKLFSTLEDFRRAHPDFRRVVVIGCTGSGKSTMLNVIGGWRLVQRPPDYTFEWEADAAGTRPIFKAAAGSHSVTNRTEFANLCWFGMPDRPFIAVDTPGHDDSRAADITQQECRVALRELAADLHNKLKALGHVHAILVIHNDVHANRLNPATYDILQMLDHKFAKANRSVWSHVVVAYSKCNAQDTAWRSDLATKKRQLQAAIRERIPNCQVDVPILALGGGELQSERWSGRRPRSRSRSPHRQEAGYRAAPDDFERLWKIIESAEPLDTSALQPFEGIDSQWQRLVDAKDAAEARAKAAAIYAGVILRLFILCAVLFWRACLIPAWMGRLLLNFPGPFDEVLYVALLAYWIGWDDVWYSCEHVWDTWLRPFVKPLMRSVLDVQSHCD